MSEPVGLNALLYHAEGVVVIYVPPPPPPNHPHKHTPLWNLLTLR